MESVKFFGRVVIFTKLIKILCMGCLFLVFSLISSTGDIKFIVELQLLDEVYL